VNGIAQMIFILCGVNKDSTKILKGIDEIGCVLQHLGNSYNIIRTIAELIHPNLMRFSIAYGPVENPLRKTDVKDMSGRPFVVANNAINMLKKTQLFFSLKYGNLPVKTKFSNIDRLIEGYVNLLLMIKAGWTDRQAQTSRKYRIFGNQIKVAEVDGISQQRVSKILHSAQWEQVDYLEKKLNGTIAHFVEDGYWRRIK